MPGISNISDNTKEEILRLLKAYQSAIDASLICSVTDLDGNIIYVNQKFCEISKYTEAELMGQNHRILNSGFHPDALFEEMWQTISSGNMWRGEVKSKAKDGSYFWQDSIILPVFDESENIIRYFSIRTPIDDKKRAEAEREERIQQLEKLLFKISHEIRLSVTQILGIATLLEETRLNQDELKFVTEGIKNASISLDLYTREITTTVTTIVAKENK